MPVVTIEKGAAVEVISCNGTPESLVPVRAYVDGTLVTAADGTPVVLMFEEAQLDAIVLEETVRELKRRKAIPMYEGA